LKSSFFKRLFKTLRTSIDLYPSDNNPLSESVYNVEWLSSSKVEESLLFVNLSLSSIIIRLAVFVPIPGIATRASISLFIIFFLKISGSILLIIVIANLGPIPLIPISNKKICYDKYYDRDKIWPKKSLDRI